MFTTDRLISKHHQVKALGGTLAQEFYVSEFISNGKANRVVVNLVDPLNPNNIGGFNISNECFVSSNFKMRYLNEYIADVIADYE